MTQFKSNVEAIDALADAYQKLSREIGKVIVGQTDVVRAVIISLFTNGHSLLVGVPGLAKTLLVSTIAEVSAMRKAGLSMEQAQARGLDQKWSGWGGGFINPAAWIGFIYQSY